MATSIRNSIGKRKEFLFTSTSTWLDEDYGGRGRAGARALQDLKPTDDTATGELRFAKSEYTVRFRKVDGRRFMALPEEEYRPSGWNGVFLMDFLDTMHGWRMWPQTTCEGV